MCGTALAANSGGDNTDHEVYLESNAFSLSSLATLRRE